MDEDVDNQVNQQKKKKITTVITLIRVSNNNIRKMRATTSAMTLDDYRHCVIAVDIYDTSLSSLERRWQERQIMRRWRIWLRMNAVLAQFGKGNSEVVCGERCGVRAVTVTITDTLQIEQFPNRLLLVINSNHSVPTGVLSASVSPSVCLLARLVHLYIHICIYTYKYTSACIFSPPVYVIFHYLYIYTSFMVYFFSLIHGPLLLYLPSVA